MNPEKIARMITEDPDVTRFYEFHHTTSDEHAAEIMRFGLKPGTSLAPSETMIHGPRETGKTLEIELSREEANPISFPIMAIAGILRNPSKFIDGDLLRRLDAISGDFIGGEDAAEIGPFKRSNWSSESAYREYMQIYDEWKDRHFDQLYDSNEEFRTSVIISPERIHES